MDRTVRKFDNPAAADRADREYYHGLTPQQRLGILLELLAQQRDGEDETAGRLERVYRIAKRGER